MRKYHNHYLMRGGLLLEMSAQLAKVCILDFVLYWNLIPQLILHLSVADQDFLWGGCRPRGGGAPTPEVATF